MNTQQRYAETLTEVRPDFIDHRRYTSPEFARLEMARIWTATWHWACREEDIPQVGDYFAYDIGDQAVILVRTGPDSIEAFHNVCPHRGRRLLSGKGRITKFHCIFHAWQWDLHGNNTRVLDREQWQGCPDMTDADVALSRVHVARWAGFVFINMSADPEPFDRFIQPAAADLEFLRMEDMRYCWHKAIRVKANWKTAQEAFMESYHILGTHPQFLQYNDDVNFSYAEGRHGKHHWVYELPPGSPSRRLDKPQPDLEGWRENYATLQAVFADQLGLAGGDGQFTARSLNAAEAAVRALPPGSSVEEAMTAGFLAMKDAAEKDGAYFPVIPPERLATVGHDWNIFPNMCVVWGADGTLIFRGRPDPEDPFNPDRAILDMISLLHWGKGKEPKVETDHIYDWRAQKDLIPKLLQQDLGNIEEVQRGMHSVGLRGLRPNPVQEVQISHFHEVINSYLFGEGAREFDGQ
ncbi:MAG: SRPBCC family protein [Porticoccaceae bacterium]|jgi:phenylpropionate dioxygenase-like ring-hydroxylating dioxygenase large terminal subunit|nr:SRPBCC family protein [Porticoccaceae bacterium]MEA3301421.1 SRPBCC family protein [Pseudomonadota bacterium]HLS98348.1 SRPBCC family protein [Porticoccaceae bacterium]